MSQAETIFRYNGAEYEFDVADAESSERLETALANMDKAEKAAPRDGKVSAIIRAHCKLIKAFFDDCFGEGAGEAVCGTKDNVNECYAAYDAFLKMVSVQRAGIVSAKNTFAKYSNRSRRKPNQPHAIPAPANARPGRNGNGGKK